MSQRENYPADCMTTRTAEAIIGANLVVVEGTSDQQCNLPGGAGAGRILGISRHAVAVGEQLEIAGPGCHARVVAAGAITKGDWVKIAGTSGKVTSTTPASEDTEVVGQAQTTVTTDGDIIFIRVAPFSLQGA